MCSFSATSGVPHAILKDRHFLMSVLGLCIVYVAKRAPVLRAMTLSTIFLRLVEISLLLGFISFTEIYLPLYLLYIFTIISQ